MFGKLDYKTAEKISEAFNTWAGETYRKEIITPAEVLNLKPIATYEGKHGSKGYQVYCYQWGDVTLLACVCADGRVLTKHVCW